MLLLRRALVCVCAVVLSVASSACSRKDTGGAPYNPPDVPTENGLFMVLGPNNRFIQDGDLTPDRADGSDFGMSPPGSTPPLEQRFTLYNDDAEGTVVLVGDLAITGDAVFAVGQAPTLVGDETQTGRIQIGPKRRAEFSIVFTPTALAKYRAEVSLNYLAVDGTANQYNFAIAATGGYGEDVNEIRVSGREQAGASIPWVEIVDGSTITTTADGTDFGEFDWDDTNGAFRGYLIQNLGGIDLNISNLTLSSSTPLDWQITRPLDRTVIPGYVGTGEIIGGSAYFEVTFIPRSPTSDIVRTATITITNNDSDEGSYTFDVVARVATADIFVSGEPGEEIIGDASQAPAVALGTDLGRLPINGVRSKVFTIRNLGNGRLDLIDVPPAHSVDTTVSSGHAADFTFDFQHTQGSLGPLDDTSLPNQTTFAILFSPSAAGARQATIRIPSNDPNEADFQFLVQGVGYVAPLSLSGPDNTTTVTTDLNPIAYLDASRYQAGNLTAETNGTSWRATAVREIGATHWFRISNPADSGARLDFDTSAPVFVVGSASSDFVIISQPRVAADVTANTVSSLVPGEEAWFALSFRPIDYGDRSALIGIRHTEVNLTSNAQANTIDPYVFQVSGLGLAPDIVVLGPTGVEIRSGDIEPSELDGTDITDRMPITQYGINLKLPPVPGVETGTDSVPHFRLGSFRSRVYTIRNVGNQALDLTGSPRINIEGSFSQAFYVPRAEHINTLHYKPIFSAEPAVTRLEPGEEATFELFADPILSGFNQASLVIRTNDPDEEAFTFDVRCFGYDPIPQLLGRNNIIADGDDSPRADDFTRFADLDGGYDFGDILGANEGRGVSPDPDPNTVENEADARDSGEQTLRFALRNAGVLAFEIDPVPSPSGSDFGSKTIQAPQLDQQGKPAGEVVSPPAEYVTLLGMGDAPGGPLVLPIASVNTPNLVILSARAEESWVGRQIGIVQQDTYNLGGTTPSPNNGTYTIASVSGSGVTVTGGVFTQNQTGGFATISSFDGAPGRYWEEHDQVAGPILVGSPAFSGTVWVIGNYPDPVALPQEYGHLRQQLDTANVDSIVGYVERKRALGGVLGPLVAFTGQGSRANLISYVDADGDALPDGSDPDLSIWRIGDAVSFTGNFSGYGTIVYVGDNFFELSADTALSNAISTLAGSNSFEYTYFVGGQLRDSNHVSFTTRITRCDFQITEQPKPSFFTAPEFGTKWSLAGVNDANGYANQTTFSVRYSPRWCDYDADPSTPEYDPPFTPHGNRVSLYSTWTGEPSTSTLINAYEYDANERPIDQNDDGVIDDQDLRPITLGFLERCRLAFNHNGTLQSAGQGVGGGLQVYDVSLKGRAKFTDVDVRGFGHLTLAYDGTGLPAPTQNGTQLGDAILSEAIHIPDGAENPSNPSPDPELRFVFNNDFGAQSLQESLAMFFSIKNVSTESDPNKGNDWITNAGWDVLLTSLGTNALGVKWIDLSGPHAHDFKLYLKMADFLAAHPEIPRTTLVQGVQIQEFDLVLDAYTPIKDVYDRDIIKLPDNQEAFFIIDFKSSAYGERLGNINIPTDHGEKANYGVPLRGEGTIGGIQ